MIEFLKKHYEIVEKAPRLYKLQIDSDKLIETLSSIAINSNFITLSQIACTDWIEDEVFALNYILTTKERDKNLMVEVRISRVHCFLPTLLTLYPQAEVMERDLHEMYGINFRGNDTLYDFALENWNEIPPLRREFDTLVYVNEHFDFRIGREDNKDVKIEVKRRKTQAKESKSEK